MMAGRITSKVKKAYDQLADQYDSLMVVSEMYREEIWSLYRKTFHAGQHILDLGCGTGTDSIFLAGMGCRVTSLDISPKMLDQLKNKIYHDKSGRMITAIQADLNDLSGLMLPGVDGAVSGFAAINTIIDMKSLAGTLYTLLGKDGKVIFHGLNKAGSTHKTSQRSDENLEMKTRMIRIGNVEVPHFLRTPSYLYKNYFKEGFELTGISGMGRYYSLYENPRYPWWLKNCLGRIESLIFDQQTLITKGRFFIIEMKRR